MPDLLSNPMNFGDINEYLKRANGEDAETLDWRSQLKNLGSPNSVAKVKEENDEGEKKGNTKEKEGKPEKKAGRKEKTDSVPADDKDVKERAADDGTERQKIHENTTPAGRKHFKNARSVKQEESPQREKPQSGKPKNIPSSNSQSSFGNDLDPYIEAFHKERRPGRRHMVYIPDDVFNALKVAYGEKRLSAVFSALALRHVSLHRDELRRRIAEQNSLFHDDS